MKINEVIRERRIAKGLTQEQMARCLNVSAPAVNKWERAVSYPDITLLPSLCRLLGIDTNTLFSFEDCLDEGEICDFLNGIHSVVSSEGMDRAFSLAMDKLNEYPSCDILWLNTALTLDGFVSMYAKGSILKYDEAIEALYLHSAKSCNVQVSCQAKAMLIARYMGKGKYAEAEGLLNDLPEQPIYDKTMLKANLCMAEGKWEEAALMIERKFLSDISGVQSYLFALTDIACKENRVADAEKISRVAGEMVRIFDLWEFGAYVADLQLAVHLQDAKACLDILKRMFPELLKVWQPDSSPLYRHIPQKVADESFGCLMLKNIIDDFEDSSNQSYDFLRNNSEVMDFIADFKGRLT